MEKAGTVTLLPHGLVFAKPITVTAPGNCSGVGAPKIVYKKNDLVDAWNDLEVVGSTPAECRNDVASFETNHFSSYQAARIDTSKCACTCGEDISEEILKIKTKLQQEVTQGGFWKQLGVCYSSLTPTTWDIRELVFAERGKDFPDGRCFSDQNLTSGLRVEPASVTVGGTCHRPGNVNYMLWGMRAAICDGITNITAPLAFAIYTQQNQAQDPTKGVAERVFWSDVGFKAYSGGAWTSNVAAAPKKVACQPNSAQHVSRTLGFTWYLGGQGSRYGSFNGGIGIQCQPENVELDGKCTACPPAVWLKKEQRCGEKDKKSPPDSLEVDNVDDVAEVTLNGANIATVNYLQTKTIDLKPLLRPGANTFNFTLRNTYEGTPYTYGFKVQLNDQVVYNRRCGTAGSTGCSGRGDAIGKYFDDTLRINRK